MKFKRNSYKLKMKKFLLYIILINLAVSYSSCDEEDAVVIVPPTFMVIDPSDEINFSIKYETTKVVQDAIHFKLINDDTSYLSFGSYVSRDWHSNNIEFSNGVSILTSNCQILGYNLTDTLITYEAFDEELMLECRQRRLYSDIVDNLPPDSSITERTVMQKYIPRQFSEGDTIHFSEIFDTVAVEYGVLRFDYSTSFVNMQGDCYLSEWEIGEWHHNSEEEKGYLVFKIDQMDKNYYGWIELGSRAGELMIFKTAYLEVEK